MHLPFQINMSNVDPKAARCLLLPAIHTLTQGYGCAQQGSSPLLAERWLLTTGMTGKHLWCDKAVLSCKCSGRAAKRRLLLSSMQTPWRRGNPPARLFIARVLDEGAQGNRLQCCDLIVLDSLAVPICCQNCRENP